MTNRPAAPATPASDKSFVAAWLPSWLVGVFGADRFYLGKIGTGIVKLLTFGGLGIWWLVDLIITLTGNATDARGRKVRGHGKEPMIAWIVTGVVVIGGVVLNAATATHSSPGTAAVTVIGSTETGGTGTGTSTDADTGTDGTDVDTTTTAPGPALTLEQQNAVKKAQTYLEFSAFSRSGLISQLEYEGFSTDDATLAADNAGADWNAQAAAKAESYLTYTSFSREGLSDQLEYEGFTPDQIAFALTAVGY